MRMMSFVQRNIIKTVIVGCAFFAPFMVIEAASLSLSPSTGVYTAGGTFTARVVVNTTGDPINAAEGTVSFNPAQLSVVSVNKGSIFNLWTVEPGFSNSAGTVTFGGGSPTGYTGSAGTVLSITFRAKTAGTAKLNFKTGSVLAADGLGTNVLTSMSGGNYTIAAADVIPEPEVIEYIAPANTPDAPVITSATHPDPNGWSKELTAKLSWPVPSGITAARTLLSEASGAIPTKVYEPAINSINIEDLEEGVQYFHLQFRNSEGWGRVAHYRLAVDTKSPTSFSIQTPDDADLSNPEQTFVLDVTDEGSGIAYYVVQIDGGDTYRYEDETGSSTVTLPSLEPGPHSLVIEAVDGAGNSLIASKSFAILAFDKPKFTEYPSELPANIIPVIKGITKPNSEVTITVSQNGVEPKNYQVTSNQGGVFVLVPEARFKEGVYELQAVAVDEFGAKSEPSDIIHIAVQQPGYIRLGSMAVSVLSLVVPLVGLVVLLVIVVMYGLNKLRRIRTVVTKETADALGIVEREFAALNKSLQSESQNLAKSRKTKKLTKAEEHLMTQMTQGLEKAQKTIKKEVSEVDDIVE